MCLHATRPFKSMKEMIIKARELEDLDQSKVPRLPKYLARFVEPKHSANNFDRLYCTFCKRNGHDIAECRSKKREMAQANGNRPETQASVQIAIPFQDLDERWTEAKATTDKSASAIAQFIVEDIIFKHGAPAIIQSDNGTEFEQRSCTKHVSDIGSNKKVLKSSL